MEKTNNKNAARRLISRFIVLFIPFIPIFIIYLWDDPFMVLKQYKRYDHSPVFLNEAYVGWQLYLNNRDSIPFDSYIMGNSCTMAYQCHEWEKYLNGGRAIQLFGNAESIVAVSMKLQALDKVGAKIKNILLIMDKESLGNTQLLVGYSNILPPMISGKSNLSFQKDFLQAFLFPSFLFPYLDYKIFHTYRPYMAGIINPNTPTHDPITNDVHNPREKQIENEGENYWENCKEEFIKKKEADYRNGKYKVASQVIKDKQLKWIQSINQICRKHSTAIKIIISPDYHQISINPTDVKILKSIFGDHNIFDFSGINEYTQNIHYYYEKGHYRPLLGNLLMKKIYSSP